MGLNFPPPRAKRKASHPYPSRKTTELFSMYSKQFQTQPLQLQYQILPSTLEKTTNFDSVNTFLGALFIPNRFNMTDMLNKFNENEILSIRVLLNNLTVSMQKDIQQELSYQQQQQSFYYQVYPQPHYYEQPMMLHYDMNIHFDENQQHYLQGMDPSFHNYDHVQLSQPHLSELHDINQHSNFFTDIPKH